MNNDSAFQIGSELMRWARDLFPICRSLTGEGVRETLTYLQGLVPAIKMRSIASGEPVFDWEVPDEWVIRDAYVADETGRRIIDFKKNNLHLVGYSAPVNCVLSKDELQPFLHSLPNQPNAIPYITSYYERRWGFCLSHNTRLSIPEGRYKVVIDAEFRRGVLNYGELLIPATDSRTPEQEILLSTYICHPSMANNELSGPVVVTALARWLQTIDRKYSYRVIFVPETIGAIAYLSRHLPEMRKRIIAGFQVTCVGDNRAYSFLPSRQGNTLADRAARHCLKSIDPSFSSYTWLDRGSDERQFCAPGIDLPVASIMRTKYGCYPEYHTSLDNFDVVNEVGLAGGFMAIKKAIQIIELNCKPKAKMLGEPQLGRRGLYPTLSTKEKVNESVSTILDLVSCADGKQDLIEIAERMGLNALELRHPLKELERHNIIELL